MSALPNILSFIDRSRAIVTVEGEDAGKFLQGLISNDIHKAGSDSWVYALLLSAQGKISLDVFIQATSNGYLLDCPSGEVEQLIKRLNFYKLRSKVAISLAPGKIRIAKGAGFKDPRHANLWGRQVVSEDEHPNIDSQTQHHIERMQFLVPDFAMDLYPDKFFPHELGMNQLNAIDYVKGCYVGQEVTARVEYRGQVRKKLHFVRLAAGSSYNKGEDIISDGLKVGIMLGHQDNFGLCQLREGEFPSLTTASGASIQTS